MPRPEPPDPHATPAPIPRPPIEFPESVEPLAPPADLAERLAALGIALEPGELDRLARYLALLLQAGREHNLTAILDPDEAWTRHILDSLTLIPVLADLPPDARIIDVGSGAGLPGLPLAITLPTRRFTLLEATGKKAEFIRHAARLLALDNVAVVAARAESAARDPQHRDAYDAAVARAVGPLNVLAELTLPFVRPGGLAVLVKGAKADQELQDAARALHLLHAAHAGTVDTPTGRLVVLEKLRPTPRAYPRRDGEPKRDPLR